jgi:cytochrome c-type biogenesis protein CcmH
MFWIVVAALILTTLLALLWPLLRRGNAADGEAREALALYRQQLRDLERDRERGLLLEAEAQEAKIEIERRILAAADTDQKSVPVKRAWRLAAMALIFAAPAFALALYAVLGSPELAQAPNAPAAVDRAASAADRAPLLARMAELRQRLEEEPDDLARWAELGRLAVQAEEYGAAAEYYGNALALAPDNAPLLASQALALIQAEDGLVTPQAAAGLQKALDREPKLPAPRYYLALARAQAGDLPGALAGWLALAKDTPKDAPWAGALEARLAETAQALGVDLEERLKELHASVDIPAGNGAAAGPQAAAAEEIEAIAQLDPEERAARVQSMVDRLAQRLEKHPDDFAGFMMLGRSRAALGDSARAVDAFARAVEIDPKSAEARAQYAIALLSSSADRPTSAEKAVQHLRQALDNDPDHAEALLFLGRIEAMRGNKDAALRHWRRLLIGLDPDSQDYAELKGQIAILEEKR